MNGAKLRHGGKYRRIITPLNRDLCPFNEIDEIDASGSKGRESIVQLNVTASSDFVKVFRDMQGDKML